MIFSIRRILWRPSYIPSDRLHTGQMSPGGGAAASSSGLHALQQHSDLSMFGFSMQGI